MISEFKFQDIKMFKGSHKIDFKPLTIFTGTNNSGKSTLISLINGVITQNGTSLFKTCPYIRNLYPLSENTSGTKSILTIADSYERDEKGRVDIFEGGTLDVYELKNIYLDGIRLSFHEISNDFPFKIEFCSDNSPILTFDPAIKMGIEDNHYYLLTLDFDELIKTLKPHSKISFFKNFLLLIKAVIEKGFPQELLRTKLPDSNENLLIFETDESNKSNRLNIRLYPSAYWSVTNTESNDFFFSYFKIIEIGLKRNQDLDPVYYAQFQTILSQIFRLYFLMPLNRQSMNYKNLINLSAYRGQFFNETKSHAYQILNELILNESELKRKEAFAAFRKYNIDLDDGSIGEKSNYFGSIIRFMERWLTEFGLGNNLQLIKKPISHAIIEHGSEGSRYFSELGFGNQQLLPIILSICLNPRGLFLVEEPESHLHPSLQSKLADFFSDAIIFNKQIQFIIETHSEYFIRKLQYLIAKKSIETKDVSLYYIYNRNNIPQNLKQIQKIDINDDGSLSQDFGSGFIDEADNLSLELMKVRHIQKN